MMLRTLAFLVLIKFSEAIIGYDCGTKALNVTTLSLLGMGDCNIPTNEVKVDFVHAQLLQINDFHQVKIHQCKITIDRIVSNCGMWSHNSIVKGGIGEYVKEIDRGTCLDLFTARRVHIGNDNYIDGITIGREVVKSITLAGKLNSEGECSGVSYSDPFGSWDNVVVTGKVKIFIDIGIVKADSDNDKIRLPSGMSCRLSDGNCIDSENGYTFWDILPVDSCKFNNYGLLYEGSVAKMTDMQGAKPVYKVKGPEITFSLSITREEHVCGYKVLRTEHPKLLIFETVPGQSFAGSNRIHPANVDMFAYVNSKFVYLEKHQKTQFKQLYHDVMYQQCKLEQDVIRNALAIATYSPDQFAYNLMQSAGYMAMAAGEVVHIIKCIPVEVKIEHSDECYAELRVTHRNATYYLSPRTHILKVKGTTIDCNPVLAPQYLIDQTWYRILHSPVAVKTPLTMEPKSKISWVYENPEYLATSGIYTEKDLKSIRDAIMFPVEKEATLNEFAREIHGTTRAKDSTILRLLNEETFERIVDNYWGKMWQKFLTFGTVSAGILSILIIIQFIKGLVEIVLNGVALHRIYGFSMHLVAALWNSLTHLLISLGTQPKEPRPRRKQKTNANQSEGVELVVEPRNGNPAAPTEDEIENTNERIYPDIKTRNDYLFLPNKQ